MEDKKKIEQLEARNHELRLKLEAAEQRLQSDTPQASPESA